MADDLLTALFNVPESLDLYDRVRKREDRERGRMPSSKNKAVRSADDLPQAEHKRIRDLLFGVGKLYQLNGWRSVDWLGYCMDPDGRVHLCGTLIEERLAPRSERSDIPDWNYRLHSRQ